MKYKFILRTGIFNREDKPVVVVKTEYPYELYSTIKKDMIGVIGDRDILVDNESLDYSLLIRHEGNKVVDTMFVKVSLSKSVSTMKSQLVLPTTVNAIFNKTGRKKITGKFKTVDVKIELNTPDKQKVNNTIVVTAMGCKDLLNIKLYGLNVVCFYMDATTLEAMYNDPDPIMDVTDKVKKEYLEKGINVMFAGNTQYGLIYTKDGDVFRVNGVDSDIKKYSQKISLDDFHDYFVQDPVYGEHIEIKFLACYKSKSTYNKQARELNNKMEIYRSIERIPYLVNLNKEAELGNIDNVVGRKEELERVYKNLLRIKKPSTILIGKAGIGKSAVYELLALNIVNNNVPKPLKDIILVEMNIGMSLSGTKYRGEFEQKLEHILKLVEKYPNIVLVIDEIHQIVGAGASSESTVDMSNILKPYLARGKVRIIGCTTKEEYEEYIKPETALARRFNVVDMYEPTKEQTIEMMKAYIPRILNKFDIDLTDSIETIYEQSKHEKGAMPDIALEAMETKAIEQYLNKPKKEVVSCQ